MDSPEGRQTRQRQLIEMYAEFHRKEVKFHGDSLGPHLEDIGKLIRETGSKTVLDYGCGRARFYKEGCAKKWGVKASLYDPAVEEYSKRPTGKFDGVISTDVLEHVLEPEVVLDEIFSLAERFVYLAICCRPSNSNKKLRDGTEFHISVYPEEWWLDKLKKYTTRMEVKFN